MKNLRAIIFILVLAFPLAIFGQDDSEIEKRKKKTSFSPYWMGMVEFGPSWSHTDLAKNKMLPDFNHIGYNGQLGIGLQFSSVFAFYLKQGFGSITDGKQDVTSPTEGLNAQWGRDMSSEITYFEDNLNVRINLSNLFDGYRDRTVNFGIHIGVGTTWWKSTTFDLNTGVEIANSGDPITISFSVLGGVYINFRVSHLVDLYIDNTYVWSNNDLVEGVESGDNNDIWSHVNFGIKFKF